MGPELATDLMLALAACTRELPGMVRFSCLENLLCQVEFLQACEPLEVLDALCELLRSKVVGA